MIQLGRLSRRGPSGFERDSRFTQDEQITHMTLWSIFRSPLMMGGDLTMIYPFTLSLLQNREVLAVNQQSENNRQLFRRDNFVAWIADIPESDEKYLALFNLGNTERVLTITFFELNIAKICSIRDLWKHKDLGEFKVSFGQLIASHGAGLYRLNPK